MGAGSGWALLRSGVTRSELVGLNLGDGWSLLDASNDMSGASVSSSVTKGTVANTVVDGDDSWCGKSVSSPIADDTVADTVVDGGDSWDSGSASSSITNEPVLETVSITNTITEPIAIHTRVVDAVAKANAGQATVAKTGVAEAVTADHLSDAISGAGDAGEGAVGQSQDETGTEGGEHNVV